MVEWIALIFSGLAIAISVIAVAYTRRQTHATEQLSSIEQRRERERSRPECHPSFSGWIKEPITATFVLENAGTLRVDRVEIKVLSGDDESRQIGFGDDTGLADRVREFGPLKPGLPVKTTFLISEPDYEDDYVKILATYAMDEDEWSERVDVKLPKPRPFAAFG